MSSLPLALTQGTSHSAAPPATVDEAFRAHAQTVARWAAQLGGPSVDVEDVVQEVFLVVARRLNDFRADASFGTWLFAITHKTVANHRRRHRWRFWQARGDEVSAVSTHAPDPCAQLEQHEARAYFYRLLGELPDKYRTVLVLYELEDMSTQQIAELCDLTLGTVKVRLHRARTQLVHIHERIMKKGRP